MVLLILWGTLAPPGRAQERTTLKAAYQGRFLPEGTELIVLHKAATSPPDSTIQPEFIARAAYPRRLDLVLRRDHLDARGETRATYPRTQPSRQRYFLYARTPDSTLYWSFSAERDSLKFDVVNKGVMSVAPVRDEAARRDILRLFFDVPAEDRVVVYMRDSTVTPDAAMPAGRRADTLQTAELASPPAPDSARPPAMAAGLQGVVQPRPPAGVTLAYPLFVALLIVLFLLAAAAAYLAYRLYDARNTISLQRQEALNLRMQFNAGNAALPDRHLEMQRALEEAEHGRDLAEQEYLILKTRYQTLLREVEAYRAEQAARAQ